MEYTTQLNEHYVSELNVRNALDYAEWASDKGKIVLDKEQLNEIRKMLDSPDKETVTLAETILKNIIDNLD
jgi:hypothetical protein